MVELLDLPDVPLRIVIEYLPVWILRLFLLCNRRLYNLIKDNFQTRGHLRLHCGVNCHKLLHNDGDELLQSVDSTAEYDLVIRFECSELVTLDTHYVLSPDLKVEYITKMLSCFPRVTHLTLALVNSCPTEIVVQLLQRWSKLKSLKLVYLYSSGLSWRQVAPVIESMRELEHFKFFAFTHEFETFREQFDSFIWSGQLRTYINTDYPQYMKESKYAIDRAVWNKPEYAKVVQKLETFGVLQYDVEPNSTNFTNVELLRKLKRVHVSYCTDLDILRRVDLTNWTAVQLLALNFGKVCFAQLFTMLSVLTNLKELTIKVDKVQLPRDRSWQNWTRLPSVRRFRLVALMEAHKFYMVAHCVPNATDCSLKHPNRVNLYRTLPPLYFERPRPSFCGECVAVMKRASEKYTNNINSFVWFRQIGEDGTHSMAPMVRLYTEDVGDSKRLSTRCIPIH